MERRIERFTQEEVLTAETQLFRSLILLLLGKKIVNESEVMLMAEFAKKRLQTSFPAPLGPRASAYVDHLLRTLQPDAPTPSADVQ
jgi:hypothetical protein